MPQRRPPQAETTIDQTVVNAGTRLLNNAAPLSAQVYEGFAAASDVAAAYTDFGDPAFAAVSSSIAMEMQNIANAELALATPPIEPPDYYIDAELQ